MKEFNLEEFKKNPSQKVVTRDGREVRIICTDMKSVDDYKIVALVKKNDGEEVILCYRKSGKDMYCPDFDLFFVSTKKEGWINIYKGAIENYLPSVGQKVYKSKEEAIRNKLNDISYLTTIKIEWEE